MAELEGERGLKEFIFSRLFLLWKSVWCPYISAETSNLRMFASQTTEDKSACICMHFRSGPGWPHRLRCVFILAGSMLRQYLIHLLRIWFNIRRHVIFETSNFFLICNLVCTDHTPARVQVQLRSMLRLPPAPHLRARVSFFFSSEPLIHVKVN